MINLKPNWEVPSSWLQIKTYDLHTGGEPLRVVVDGLPEIKGNTILEKRRYFRDHLDYIRKGIIFEPRGHADMYGAIITPAISEDADFGSFFLHNEGYSTMCGHAIIALTKLVLDTGMIYKEGDNPELIIDAPPGKISVTAKREKGIVKSVSFKNVPSYVHKLDQEIEIEGMGKIKFDIAFGGAYYVFCQVEQFGLQLNKDDYNNLIHYGRKIKHAIMDQYEIHHPTEPDLSFLYGTIFIDHAEDPNHHSRNVCVFAEGEVDRSATGSGVSGRAAIHHRKSEIVKNQKITIESILGTTMTVEVVDELDFEGYPAIIPEVTGTASIIGVHQFLFDPLDPLKEGFIFR